MCCYQQFYLVISKNIKKGGKEHMGYLKNKCSKNPELKALIGHIELAAKEVLEDRMLLSYSDHGINHSYRIINSLELLCPTLTNAKTGLNSYEAFVLLSSIYLHDIGMQLQNKDTLSLFCNKYKVSYNVEEKDEFIRKYHHLLSKFWIEQNILDKNCQLKKVYFGSEELGLMIAEVVESHGIDFIKDERYKDKSYKGKLIRITLICALLCLGDVLDCDCRRVNYERLSHAEISLVSKIHWMKHYYVDSVLIDNNSVKIYYSFPKLDESIQNMYYDYFSFETKKWIEKCKNEYFDEFKSIGINFQIIEQVEFSEVKKALNKIEFTVVEEALADIYMNNSGDKRHLSGQLFQIVIGIIKHNNKVLMVKRRIPEGNLCWQFPAGIVKPGYSKTETVIKEVFKETGVKVDLIKKIGKRFNCSTSVIAYYYALKYIEGMEYNADEDENTQVEWISILNYDKIITSDIYAKVSQYLLEE